MTLRLNIKILFLPILLLAGLPLYAQSPPESAEIWQKGLKAKESGSMIRALEIWNTALEDSLDANPNIGISYIELVAGQKLKKFYKDASAMYMWGLSGCTSYFEEILEKEIERVGPVAEGETHKQWERLLEDNPGAACKAVANFWKETDPTIPTSYNERLIEHWERIAYARENYDYNHSSVYGADERALIYVKLGAPDYIKNGTLHFSTSLVRAWVRRALESQPGGSPAGFPNSGGDSASGAAMQRQYMAQMMRRNFIIDGIVKEARLNHRYPYYEIWVYRELLPETRENVIYIFGNDGNTGEFRMQRSLEEMIPNSAFRMGFDRSPVTSGLLLQMLFYEQTSIAGQYFADAFNELQNRLFSMNGLYAQMSFSLRSRKASQLRFLQYKAPPEKSTHLEKMPGIDLKVFQYRLLDKNNRPYLATFVESRPQKAFLYDQLVQRNFDGSNYQLYHYARLSDRRNIILDKQTKASKIFLAESGNVRDMKKSTAYFSIPYKSEDAEQVFSVELHNQEMDSSRIGDAVFPENIRGIGTITKHQPEPLSTSANDLEVSDVLIGIEEPPENQIARGPTPFRVLHDHIIPNNENMMVHFEVYHLASGSPDPNKFKVEYQISRKKNNILQRIFGGSTEQVRLTLNFETLNSFSVNNLEVVTSPFEPGSYELSLKITEPGTNQTVEREIDFEIRG